MCLSILFVLAISLILKNTMEVFCVYLVNNDCQCCLQNISSLGLVFATPGSILSKAIGKSYG